MGGRRVHRWRARREAEEMTEQMRGSWAARSEFFPSPWKAHTGGAISAAWSRNPPRRVSHHPSKGPDLRGRGRHRTHADNDYGALNRNEGARLDCRPRKRANARKDAKSRRHYQAEASEKARLIAIGAKGRAASLAIRRSPSRWRTWVIPTLRNVDQSVSGALKGGQALPHRIICRVYRDQRAGAA